MVLSLVNRLTALQKKSHFVREIFPRICCAQPPASHRVVVAKYEGAQS
jgi:hypothetical protein